MSPYGMKTILVCTFVVLSVCRPQDPVNNQEVLNGEWVRQDHDLYEVESEVPEDYRFEYYNPEFTDDGEELFEADIVLSEEQQNSRQAMTNLWTSPVKFAITSGLSHKRDNVLAAIQHWRDNSCIEFEEIPEGSSEKHISFYKGSGCWSAVGMTKRSGGQKISIGNGCAPLNVIAHEIGHSMGLRHQQSRTDRDTYVTIHLENVLPGKAGNFKIAENSFNYSVPYDLTSCMHYGPKLFNIDEKKTITVNNFLYEDLIGHGKGLSHRDRKIINIMYRCASSCSAPPTCQNGGFVNRDCACDCPWNTAGANCEILNGSYYPAVECGDLDMTSEGTITSPHYPGHSPEKATCWWVITAGQGQRIKVTITDMNLPEAGGNGKCKQHKLTLRYNGDDHNEDQTACGVRLKGQSFTSVGNRFIVKFVTGGGRKNKGFSADVEFLD